MTKLEENNINLFGEYGKRWIDNIPIIIEYLSKKWKLTEITPYKNLSWNYIAKANAKDHGSVCIKVSIDETLIADEIKALEYFNGHEMVELLDHYAELHALLLHQAIPGKSLKELYLSNKEEAMAIYTQRDWKCEY